MHACMHACMACMHACTHEFKVVKKNPSTIKDSPQDVLALNEVIEMTALLI